MTASAALRHIIKRDGNLVPYDRDRIVTAIFRALAATASGARAAAEALGLEVERALVRNYGAEVTPSVEDIQDLVVATLKTAGRRKTAQAYETYRLQRAQARAARAYSFEVSDNIPYKAIYEVLRWNMDHRCHAVEELNRLIAEGRYDWLVREADRRLEEDIAACAHQIAARRGTVRLVIIAGPSSSGKTTVTLKLCARLRAAGLGLTAISVDHYFFDLQQHPRDEFGDYDYETPEALDLALLDEQVSRLLAGETVRTPHYDFKTGRRRLEAHEMRLAPDQVLLLDSLHGLFDRMTRRTPDAAKFKVYVETLGQLRADNGEFMRWADNRLLRRMLRDAWHRNSQPEETLTHWHYVRRSELQHIIPYIRTADFLVNTALPYEMPLLKHHLFDAFPPYMRRYRHDPLRQDAYIRAKRIAEFLQPVTAIPDDRAIPPTSLLREFIGGSAYAY